MITPELDHTPEQSLNKLLDSCEFSRNPCRDGEPTLAAESPLAKDWLASEEDSVWANL